MMKKIFLSAFILVVIVLTAGGYYVNKLYMYKNPSGKNITIAKGFNAGKISQKLEREKIISSRYLFLAIARSRHIESRMKSGDYTFQRGMNINEVLEKLYRGNIKTRLITIPEGIDIKECSLILAKQNIGTETECLLIMRDTDFIRGIFPDTPPETLEGYLFPETYRVRTDIATRDFIRMVVNNSINIYNDLSITKNLELPLSRHEVFTLASIIEKETANDTEKKRIASVYVNRLSAGWKLEADPTVQYALGKHKKRLYYKHLRIDSPYNTYLYTGLPPGPIANPGKYSLDAVLSPEKTRYFYFVAKGDGTHLFSRTKKQHLYRQRKLRR